MREEAGARNLRGGAHESRSRYERERERESENSLGILIKRNGEECVRARAHWGY